jgi:hypothetical protein
VNRRRAGFGGRAPGQLRDQLGHLGRREALELQLVDGPRQLADQAPQGMGGAHLHVAVRAQQQQPALAEVAG